MHPPCQAVAVKRRLQHWLEARWYGGAPVPAWLAGLERLYARLAARDRRRQQARQRHVPAPVIVVGNIAVGGSGKTPLVIALVQQLRKAGWRPGVVSRGYGRRGHQVHLVASGDTSAQAGDEPLLIARATSAPVMVGADRHAAARALLATGSVDIIVADDGLQHLALGRDVEIVVIDGRRRFGNGRLLPAGPLREAPARLDAVDLVLVNGPRRPDEAGFDLVLGDAQPLLGGPAQPLAAFTGTPVHAVAGIGDPERFFAALRRAGLQTVENPFPDHHHFRASDLDFPQPLPVLMTAKDAVKCQGFARPGWFQVPVTLRLDPPARTRLQAILERLATTRQ